MLNSKPLPLSPIPFSPGIIRLCVTVDRKIGEKMRFFGSTAHTGYGAVNDLHATPRWERLWPSSEGILPRSNRRTERANMSGKKKSVVQNPKIVVKNPKSALQNPKIAAFRTRIKNSGTRIKNPGTQNNDPGTRIKNSGQENCKVETLSFYHQWHKGWNKDHNETIES